MLRGQGLQNVSSRPRTSSRTPPLLNFTAAVTSAAALAGGQSYRRFADLGGSDSISINKMAGVFTGQFAKLKFINPFIKLRKSKT